jgi:hypothetical protein
MFYFDLYIINVYVILPPDLGPFAVNKYIHTYISSRVLHNVEVEWLFLLIDIRQVPDSDVCPDIRYPKLRFFVTFLSPFK